MYRISHHVSGRRQMEVDHFFATHVDRFKSGLAQLESEIDPTAMPCRGDEFHLRTQAVMQASIDACREFELEHGDDPALIREVQASFRNDTAPWLQHSWFAHRAHTKPSGFSGDFDMLLKLYHQATPARGLGGYVDLCMIDFPLARAVRTRLVAIREFLLDEIERRSGHIRVLDIASGPCHEFRDWPDVGGNRDVEIVALDNDPVALAYVEDNVIGQMPAHTSLRTTRYNAIRTQSAAANIRKFGKFDIIYSSGLCDYLTDDMLIGMLSGWRETLNEGGVMYVAFKDTKRYDKTPYQWHLDWFFYQRTLKDCLSLYEQAGFEVETIEAVRDASGIIFSFISRALRDHYLRVDPPRELRSPRSAEVPRTAAQDEAAQG